MDWSSFAIGALAASVFWLLSMLGQANKRAAPADRAAFLRRIRELEVELEAQERAMDSLEMALDAHELASKHGWKPDGHGGFSPPPPAAPGPASFN